MRMWFSSPCRCCLCRGVLPLGLAYFSTFCSHLGLLWRFGLAGVEHVLGVEHPATLGAAAVEAAGNTLVLFATVAATLLEPQGRRLAVLAQCGMLSRAASLL
jgi:hypothetical protein